MGVSVFVLEKIISRFEIIVESHMCTIFQFFEVLAADKDSAPMKGMVQIFSYHYDYYYILLLLLLLFLLLAFYRSRLQTCKFGSWKMVSS